MTDTALAPVVPRAGSAAAAVHDWVAALQEWSIFETGDVPGPRQIVAKTLSQMAVRDPRLERVAQGTYIRVENPWGKGVLVYDRGRVAMAIAGSGSGYGALTAVNKVGWNWQPTVRLQISVTGRAPRSSVRLCEFLSRSNEARRELTWAEVTVLEALRFSTYAGWEWETCVEIVSDGSAVKRLGPDALLRSDALREVGELEPRVSGAFRSRLRSLTDAMPATVAADGC